MFIFVRRCFLNYKPCTRLIKTHYVKKPHFLPVNSEINQVGFLKEAIANSDINWSDLRNDALKIPGGLNSKNLDAVLLKLLISSKNFKGAQSFADYLKKCDALTLGSTNAILFMYYNLGRNEQLGVQEKQFILETYDKLYAKYKVLDSTTSERLLHALCIIGECEKAFKVLDDIHQSFVPTHSAYSNLIAALFKSNRKADAFNLIEKSLNHRRPLQYIAYAEWIKYILRKYKTNKTIIKHLDDICVHITRNSVTLNMAIANEIRETYASLNWNAQFSKIDKESGQCNCCKETLQCLNLTETEFKSLQNNVKEKLIVGSDLFLKTSPEELRRFLDFFERTAPYDIVLDALNIAFSVGNPNNQDRLKVLKNTVDHFKNNNKRVMLLGRKHMLRWPKQPMDYLRENTFSFFTDDLSQDDPFFITAAILSGAYTDIVSKDLLRGHRFLLKDENLRHLFRRWQWQHQWMVFCVRGRLQIQPPLKFTPIAQKNGDGWHLPYEKEDQVHQGQINDGTPDLTSWLCLKPKLVNK